MRELQFRYELRTGDQILATGHLSVAHPLHIGDELALGTKRGIVAEIAPIPGSHESRLVIKLASNEPTLGQRP